MSAPISLDLLHIFVSVAQTSSFSEAARRLGLPRSSVSRQIAALEGSVGVQLFQRTTRHVALSTAGEALFERVAPQLEELRKALGTLPERDELPSGDLRVTAPADLGAALLPDILAGFLVRYPGVNVELRLSSSYLDLVAEGMDVALRAATRMPDSSLVARKLLQAELGLFASPVYLARRGPVRTPQDACAHDWVAFRGRPLPPPFPKPARRPRVNADDMMVVAQAVRAGLGIGALPVFLAKSEVSGGQLVRLLPRVSLRTGALYFVHPRAANVPRKVTAFRDFLIEYLAAHPA